MSVSSQTSNRAFRAVVLSMAAAAAAAVAVTGVPVLAQLVAKDETKLSAVPPSPRRLPDGHPNWTGFWSAPVNGVLDQNIGLGGTPAGPPPSADGKGPPPPPPPPFADFPPLKSPYKERQAAFFDQMMTTGAVADPVARCLPPGMPRMMTMVYGMEVLQTPKVIEMTSEWQAASRHIWLDRKTHPAADELDPTYAGDSIGHWEGDTLVVDTVGIRDDVLLNYTGLTHSPKLHIVERFHEIAPGILVDDFEIDDADVFDGVWHHREIYRHRPDLHIQEYVCLENNRNVGADGRATFDK